MLSYSWHKILYSTAIDFLPGLSSRNRDEEIIKILLADSIDEADLSKVWWVTNSHMFFSWSCPYLTLVLARILNRMIVPSRWIKEWLMFAHLKVGKEPKQVTMMSLLVTDPTVPGKLRPNRSLKRPNAEGTSQDEEAPGHYRWGVLQLLLLPLLFSFFYAFSCGIFFLFWNLFSAGFIYLFCLPKRF